MRSPFFSHHTHNKTWLLIMGILFHIHGKTSHLLCPENFSGYLSSHLNVNSYGHFQNYCYNIQTPTLLIHNVSLRGNWCRLQQRLCQSETHNTDENIQVQKETVSSRHINLQNHIQNIIKSTMVIGIFFLYFLLCTCNLNEYGLL